MAQNEAEEVGFSLRGRLRLPHLPSDFVQSLDLYTSFNVLLPLHRVFFPEHPGSRTGAMLF
jgi:hypothetical protein